MTIQEIEQQRIIKFQVFCEKHNRWETYTIGDLVCGSTTTENGEGGIFKGETWRQFIGAVDKTGNDIYDGDIYERNGYVYLVIWDMGWYYYTIWDNWLEKNILERKTRSWIAPYDAKERFTVIGNKFDNPELLAMTSYKPGT